jgi:hypothetical protein
MSIEPDFSSMNETDVREIIVRPLLELLGYGHGTDATIRTEQTLRYSNTFLGRKNPKKDPALVGRADYICDVISFGRWVVEVKSPSEDRDVVEQAHTYAAHPEIAASFFLVTNGRMFKLYETAKLEKAALEWAFDDADDNLLRLLNILSPAAFRKRAKITLVDPGKPLGTGLPSRLRIVGGEITYDDHSSSHPLLRVDSISGLRLPVTGGRVLRTEDKRIVAHIVVAKVAPLMHELNEAMGISDGSDFFSATEYLSTDPEHPTIFQNLVTTNTPAGTLLNIPGLGKIPMPFAVSCAAFTEAVGFAIDDKFVGTMKLSYDYTFSKIPPHERAALELRMGPIPDTAHMDGSGRFEVFLLEDL